MKQCADTSTPIRIFGQSRGITTDICPPTSVDINVLIQGTVSNSRGMLQSVRFCLPLSQSTGPSPFYEVKYSAMIWSRRQSLVQMLEAGEPASEPSLSVPYWDRWRHVSFYSSNLAIINASLECIVSFKLSFPYSHCSSASYTPVFRRGPPFTLSTAHAADLEAVSQSTLDRVLWVQLTRNRTSSFHSNFRWDT